MNWDEMAVVGRIARPHGIHGQVVINPETDFPDERFRIGAELFLKPALSEHSNTRSLRIGTVRFQNGRPIVGFEGVDDMNAARALAGSELRIPVEHLSVLPPEMFYRHDLIGCSVVTADGSPIGQVTEVEGTLAGSRLVVATTAAEVLIPLASEICRSIDVAGKRIVIEPPEGLLDLNAKRQ